MFDYNNQDTANSFLCAADIFVKLRQGLGKDWQGMVTKRPLKGQKFKPLPRAYTKKMGHLRVTKGHLRVTVGYPRVTIGHPRVTMGHLRLTIGYLKATLG